MNSGVKRKVDWGGVGGLKKYFTAYQQFRAGSPIFASRFCGMVR